MQIINYWEVETSLRQPLLALRGTSNRRNAWFILFPIIYIIILVARVPYDDAENANGEPIPLTRAYWDKDWVEKYGDLPLEEQKLLAEEHAP